MDALSREYLAPLAAMGDIYWSGYQELKSGPLLKYAIYELYGYTGEEKLDLAAAYGTADAEKRAELAKLMDTNYDASGKLPNAQNFYLPQEEVAAAIQKHFDMSPEMADASLKDLHNYDGYFWVSPWNLGDNLFAYAREATIEGDTLTIRYSLYEAQPAMRASWRSTWRTIPRPTRAAAGMPSPYGWRRMAAGNTSVGTMTSRQW